MGTLFIIEKAQFITGGVSDTTSCTVYGRVYPKEKGKEYPFQYGWGDYRSLYENEPYWNFNVAFWQEKALDSKFYIDVP